MTSIFVLVNFANMKDNVDYNYVDKGRFKLSEKKLKLVVSTDLLFTMTRSEQIVFL
jgi:hypothetical protein